MTHCTSTIVAFRFACRAGNATFTTVPSMNAMLEARVVAASTQRPARFEQGAAAGRERITLSSHGSRRIGNIGYCSLLSRLLAPARLLISTKALSAERRGPRHEDWTDVRFIFSGSKKAQIF